MEFQMSDLLKDLAEFLQEEVRGGFAMEMLEFSRRNDSENVVLTLAAKTEESFSRLVAPEYEKRMNQARKIIEIFDSYYGVSPEVRMPAPNHLVEIDLLVGFGAIETKLGYFKYCEKMDPQWMLILDSGFIRPFDMYHKVLKWRYPRNLDINGYPRKIYTSYNETIFRKGENNV